MENFTATAQAHPNIAFIKYWGNRDDYLRLPLNGSISMNLEDLVTKTTVVMDESLSEDILFINEQPVLGDSLSRVQNFMNIIRVRSEKKIYTSISSYNNFPAGAGIASSAAAFAALCVAACRVFDLPLDFNDLSRLARRGSGSACRSIPGGFSEWLVGTSDHDSYAISIAPPNHWALIDIVAIVEDQPKKVGSSEGHKISSSSIIQDCRLADAPRRLDICRNAILQKDFEKLAIISELDSNLMHAVMITSTPPLFYWSPTTIFLMKYIQEMRKKGTPVFYTVDAGPNVHVITEIGYKDEVSAALSSLPGVEYILSSRVGGPARLIS